MLFHPIRSSKKTMYDYVHIYIHEYKQCTATVDYIISLMRCSFKESVQVCLSSISFFFFLFFSFFFPLGCLFLKLLSIQNVIFKNSYALAEMITLAYSAVVTDDKFANICSFSTQK